METAGNIYTIITEMENDFQREYKMKVTRCSCIVTACIFNSPANEHTMAFCIILQGKPWLPLFSGSLTESAQLQQLAMTCSWSLRFAPEHNSCKRNYLSNTNCHTRLSFHVSSNCQVRKCFPKCGNMMGAIYALSLYIYISYTKL